MAIPRTPPPGQSEANDKVHTDTPAPQRQQQTSTQPTQEEEPREGPSTTAETGSQVASTPESATEGENTIPIPETPAEGDSTLVYRTPATSKRKASPLKEALDRNKRRPAGENPAGKSYNTRAVVQKEGKVYDKAKKLFQTPGNRTPKPSVRFIRDREASEEDSQEGTGGNRTRRSGQSDGQSEAEISDWNIDLTNKKMTKTVQTRTTKTSQNKSQAEADKTKKKDRGQAEADKETTQGTTKGRDQAEAGQDVVVEERGSGSHSEGTLYLNPLTR